MAATIAIMILLTRPVAARIADEKLAMIERANEIWKKIKLIFSQKPSNFILSRSRFKIVKHYTTYQNLLSLQ